MISIILSTYERPRALALAMEGIREGMEGAPPAELLVADDGSGPGTAACVERFSASAAFPVVHIRQEHTGFRLAAVRNLAVRSSRGEILIFIDGDCLLDPRALRIHARRCRPGKAHTGSRIFLEERETEDLLSELPPAGTKPWARTASAAGAIAKRALRRGRWGLLRLYALNRIYRAFRWKPRPKLLAANCAIHRTDFEKVNGFDERFVGWGLEDEDLARRLRRTGARIDDGTLDCLALHLFHPVDPSHRPSVRGTPNDRYFRRGRFLTRPLLGLEKRRIEDIRFEILGEPPERLRPFLAALGIGNPPGAQAPEVSLIFSGTRGSRRPRGEIALEIPPGIPASGPEPLRDLLAEVL